MIEASNGVEAMEALEEKNGAVDLVVSDVVMPEMDGPTLLQDDARPQSRTSRSSSCRAMPKMPSRRACRRTSKFAFLPKPFTLSQLVAAVKETMTPS